MAEYVDDDDDDDYEEDGEGFPEEPNDEARDDSDAGSDDGVDGVQASTSNNLSFGSLQELLQWYETVCLAKADYFTLTQHDRVLRDLYDPNPLAQQQQVELVSIYLLSNLSRLLADPDVPLDESVRNSIWANVQALVKQGLLSHVDRAVDRVVQKGAGRADVYGYSSFSQVLANQKSIMADLATLKEVVGDGGAEVRQVAAAPKKSGRGKRKEFGHADIDTFLSSVHSFLVKQRVFEVVFYAMHFTTHAFLFQYECSTREQIGTLWTLIWSNIRPDSPPDELPALPRLSNEDELKLIRKVRERLTTVRTKLRESVNRVLTDTFPGLPSGNKLWTKERTQEEEEEFLSQRDTRLPPATTDQELRNLFERMEEDIEGFSEKKEKERATFLMEYMRRYSGYVNTTLKRIEEPAKVDAYATASSRLQLMQRVVAITRGLLFFFCALLFSDSRFSGEEPVAFLDQPVREHEEAINQLYHDEHPDDNGNLFFATSFLCPLSLILMPLKVVRKSLSIGLRMCMIRRSERSTTLKKSVRPVAFFVFS